MNINLEVNGKYACRRGRRSLAKLEKLSFLKQVMNSFRRLAQSSRNLDIIALVVVCALAFSLRFYNYANFPDATFNWDEWAYAWTGRSLILQNRPIGWSSYALEVYEKYGHTLGSTPPPVQSQLVEPWMDNPWLFALMAGLSSVLGGKCDFSTMRIPSVLMTTACAGLVYLIGKKLYSRETGFLAALFFAVVPAIVIFNRQALGENGIIFFTLIAFYAALKYLDGGKRKWLFTAAIGAGLASLCKFAGLASIVFIAGIFASEKRWRDMKIVLGLGAALFAIYPLCGAIYGWKTFVAIIFAHSGRVIYSAAPTTNPVIGSIGQSLEHIFLTTGFHWTTYFTDWWVIFSWLTIAYVFFEMGHSKQDRWLASGIASNLLMLVIVTGLVYGWYVIPLYPFFCLANGRFMSDMLKKPSLIAACLFVVTIFFSQISWFLPTAITESSYYGRILFLAVLAPYIAHFVMQQKRTRIAGTITTALLLATFFAASILMVLDYTRIYSLLT